MSSSRSSGNSRSGSGHTRSSVEGQQRPDEEEQTLLRGDLLDRVTTSSSRGRRSQRASATLHDLEVMQAVQSSAGNNSTASDEDLSQTSSGRSSRAAARGLSVTGSAQLRLFLEGDHDDISAAAPSAAAVAPASMMDTSGVSQSSTYSEYSEYEEDEFDPEWHSRQNQQAAMALLARSSGGPGGTRNSFQTNLGTDGTTERTRSVSSFSDVDAFSDARSAASSQIFASRRDLRDEVDQSVNLMDANAANYEPRQQSRTTNFLAAAQNSFVDVFLDNSDPKVSPFRRTLSRGSAGSVRRQGSGTADPPSLNQRRLFYGHGGPPPTRPTIIRDTSYASEVCLENCCKLVIVLFVCVFIIILALPQGGTYWIQERLGLTRDGNGTILLPSPGDILAPVLDAFVSVEDARLESLRHMISLHELTSKDDLLNEESPQYQASVWLAQVDPAQLPLDLENDDDATDGVHPHQVLNRYALATFFLAMNGPKRDSDSNEILWNQTSQWHSSQGWMSAKHICDWQGIECEGPDHIEHFNLTQKRLVGSIPSELRILTDLILVDWSANEVTGTIPEWMGDSWSYLEFLLLNRNSLQGTLSPGVANMTRLLKLDLSDNALEGNIPAEFNQLTRLRYLTLDRNKFGGPIPRIGNPTAALEKLSMDYNFLTGSIPDAIFQLTNLVELKVERNQLNGTISPDIGSLSKLEVFTISKNRFTGSLPDVWNNTPGLVELEVDNNHIRGPIPAGISGLSSLQYLTLAGNPLTGTIPTELGMLENLVVFQVYHTQLFGSMPDEFCSLRWRRGIDLIVFGDCDEGRFDCRCCDRCY